MFRLFRVLIEFPALDRLLTHLENTARAQAAIDAQTQRIKDFSAALKAALIDEENK